MRKPYGHQKTEFRTQKHILGQHKKDEQHGPTKTKEVEPRCPEGVSSFCFYQDPDLINNGDHFTSKMDIFSQILY